MITMMITKMILMLLLLLLLKKMIIIIRVQELFSRRRNTVRSSAEGLEFNVCRWRSCLFSDCSVQTSWTQRCTSLADVLLPGNGDAVCNKDVLNQPDSSNYHWQQHVRMCVGDRSAHNNYIVVSDSEFMGLLWLSSLLLFLFSRGT